MRTWMQWITSAVLLSWAVTVNAAVLYQDDFEGGINGFVRNISLQDGAGRTGSGKALYLEDTTDDATYLEFNFGDRNYGAVHLSYDIYNENGGLSGLEENMVVGIGPYNASEGVVLNATDARSCDVWFYTGDGTRTQHDVKFKGAGTDVKTKYTAQTLYSVDLFANDSDSETISYNRPDGLSGTLAPNTSALFINNSFVGENTLRSAVATGNETLGRAIFYSGSSYVSSQFYIDNLLVETLGEPSGGEPVNPPDAAVLYQDDFEGGINGYVRNISLQDGTGRTGSGKALYLEDTTIDDATYLEFNFGNRNYGTVHMSYDIYNENGGLSGLEENMVVGIGPYNASEGVVLNATDARSCDVWFYTGDGTRTQHDIKFKGAGTDVKTKYTAQTLYSVDLFANDSDSEVISYNRPDGLSGTLAPNTAALFINNSFIGENTLRSAAATGDETLGRAIFYSGKTYVSSQFYIDNLLVETLGTSSGGSSNSTSVLLSVDFAGQTVGEQPTGAATILPSINTVNDFVSVVDSNANTVGDGEAVQFYDNDTGDGGMLTYNFVSDAASQVSAVRVDFSFAPLETSGAGTEYIAVALGEYSADKTLNSYTRRYTDARLYDDGTLDLRSDFGSSAPYSLNNTLQSDSNSLSIFVNDYDSQSIEYTGLDSSSYTLPANSVAYWLNGSLVTMNGGEQYTTMDTDDATSGGTIGTTEDNLGKFGFNSTSAAVGLSYLFDSIEISSLTNLSSGGSATNSSPQGLNGILSVDFEGQSVGAPPSGADSVRPLENTNDVFTAIVDSSVNPMGTANAVQLYDGSAANLCNLEYNFVNSANDQLSAVRVDFSVVPLTTSGAGDDYIAVSLGEYNTSRTFGASGARLSDLRLYNDGTMDVRNVDFSLPASLNNALSAVSNRVSIIANDYDSQSITYTGLDDAEYTLPANSVAYWLNGSLVTMSGGEEYTSLDLSDSTDEGAGTVGTTEYNLGKFGFNTGTSDIDLNYVIDDIVVYEFVSSESTPELHVHNLFQNHMVLQRNQAAPVWGTATPGLRVQVYLDDVLIGSDAADANGDWKVSMPSHAADGGTAHVLKVTAEGAPDTVLTDVIYGDVYLCSGQSNMAFAMSSITNYDAISGTLTNALIRQVNVNRSYSETLLDEPVSYYYPWERGDDLSDVRHFTAIGYLTALEIQKETGVPIGLLHSSYGGMEINMFLNDEALSLMPELAGLIADSEQGGATDLHDIYNAMIGPLVPYGICGILWYQGESDRDKPAIYEQKMIGLIRGWRAAWALGSLPFYYVQLPNYAPGDQDYPKIREAQLNALSETNTGMAVTIDVGDNSNIHPTNKQDPCHRLAQWVLSKNYGRDNVFSGPIFYDVENEGSQLRVLFDYAGSGLMVGQKDGTNAVVETSGALQNFEIAGSDRVFVDAVAVIDADTVVVSAASVPAPRYVRYCYEEAPSGLNKLYNKEGFPASPFRTDSSHDLKVINGSGSREAVTPGTVISISANSPASGKVFDRWVGAVDAVANVSSASTTITMPDCGVYLTARYRDSSAGTYTLTVNNGTGSSSVEAGAVVMIEAAAAPEGQVFSSWSGDTAFVTDPSAALSTVRMPASDVTLTATYENAPETVPADLTVSNFTVRAHGGVSFRFPNTAGYRYEISSTTNLVSGKWTIRAYNIRGSDRARQVDLDDEETASRFYRIKVK